MFFGNRDMAFEMCAVERVFAPISGYTFQEMTAMRQTYTSIVASGDHVPQLVLTSRSGAQVVADWLVPLPPGPPRAVENNVLIGRGDLCENSARRQ